MENILTVIIPHYNGMDILRDCLESLYKNTFKDFNVILIDNGSTDGSQEFLINYFPQVKVVQNEQNRGYAGACNQGMLMNTAEYVLLLNNDTVLAENMLSEMLDTISASADIAMVQPKIKSIQQKEKFDYSGAAGGEMDIFGYPFARGRIFDFVEKDDGQYDAMVETVFWTSGCALLIRKSVLDQIGLLDEDFFAHQEEIDLNWRAQLAGYRNVVTCKTHIYHYSGYTLKNDSTKKMYLNHRNNLIMLLKNYSFLSLLLLFPVRILFEIATFGTDLIIWRSGRYGAVFKSLWFLLSHPLFIYKKRRETQKIRLIKDKTIQKNMYKGSIAYEHYFRKHSPVSCIKKYRPLK